MLTHALILASSVAMDDAVPNPFSGMHPDFSWLMGKYSGAFLTGFGILWGLFLIAAAARLLPVGFHLREAIKKNVSHDVDSARKELLGSLLVFGWVGGFLVVLSVAFLALNMVMKVAG